MLIWEREKVCLFLLLIYGSDKVMEDDNYWKNKRRMSSRIPLVTTIITSGGWYRMGWDRIGSGSRFVPYLGSKFLFHFRGQSMQVFHSFIRFKNKRASLAKKKRRGKPFSDIVLVGSIKTSPHCLILICDWPNGRLVGLPTCLPKLASTYVWVDDLIWRFIFSFLPLSPTGPSNIHTIHGLMIERGPRPPGRGGGA